MFVLSTSQATEQAIDCSLGDRTRNVALSSQEDCGRTVLFTMILLMMLVLQIYETITARQPSGLLMFLDSKDEVPEDEMDRITVRDNLKLAQVIDK